MAADIFVLPTVTLRLLFVLVILAHDRRRIVHVAVTEHPTAAWTAQQLRNAFPENESPRYLLHDRDSVFAHVATTLGAMNTQAIRTAPRSPWQNAYVGVSSARSGASASNTSSWSTAEIRPFCNVCISQFPHRLLRRREQEPALLAVTPAGTDDVSGVVDVTRFR